MAEVCDGTVDRDGFRLEWVREGEGIPMLVIGAHRYYGRVFPQAMRRYFEMIFFNSRHWAPTPDGFDLDSIMLRTFSDDTEAIREATGLDRPIVLGHSHHGILATVYTQHYPNRARGLALVAPNPPSDSLTGMEPPEAFFRRDASPERLACHEENRSSRPVHAQVETAQQFVDNYVANDARSWFDLSFDCRPFWEDVEINLSVLQQLHPQLSGWRLEPTDVPTFLALGRYDYVIPYSLWDGPKHNFNNLTHRLYEQSAHTPQHEQPDEFTADIVAWARQL